MKKKLIKFYWPKFLSVFLFLVLFASYANIFAVFTPGQTLNPNCAPGATGCTVDTARGITWIPGGEGLPFSIGPDVTFTKNDYEVIGTAPQTPTDNISSFVHLKRDEDKGLYNAVTEYSFDNNNYTSPAGTEWNSDGWSDFSDVTTRSYDSLYNVIGGSFGNNIIGPELVMHDIGADKYYKFEFTFWSSGDNGGRGGFTYNRTLINTNDFSLGTTVTFDRPDSTFDIPQPPTDNISPSVHITRGVEGPIYNTVFETYNNYDSDISPTGTEWNSDGWNDLSDVDSRSYTNFTNALSNAVGNNILGSELVMHDISEDKYYKFSFSSWTQGDGNNGLGGGFSYTRNLINLPNDVPNKLFTSSNLLIKGDNRYLNFGLGTGRLGYGFRDNGGVIEFKNKSDEWTPLDGGGSAISLVNGSSLFSSGINAGSGTGVSNSNFFGSYSGYNAYSASNSNFLGGQAGMYAYNASNSNFLGNNSGYQAQNATQSNFFGQSTGQYAYSANNSNFFGQHSGYQAQNASNSNFLGTQSGYYAQNARNSIFIGQQAGINDTVNNTSNGLSSILLGSFTNTGGYSNSIVLGSGISGSPISNTKANQFMLAPSVTEMRLRGVDYTLPSAQASTSGQVLTNNGSGGLSWTTVSGGGSSPVTVVNSSNLFSSGIGAGSGVTATDYSNFLGYYAGQSASNASRSNFLGINSGSFASSASDSNFFGSSAGQSATSASNSNFLGNSAGLSATSASNSNFLGFNSGNSATDASFSNFIGFQTGLSATFASASNFIGSQAGQAATNANHSNFLGFYAGYMASNASFSNFIGSQAGQAALNASNSIFIGHSAGENDTVNNTSNGLSSILLGSFTNTGGYSNSIVLGSGISGSPISNTKANQFMLAPSVTEMRLRGVDYTLPSAQASTSGQVLTNNGSGGLSWTTVSGGGSYVPYSGATSDLNLGTYNLSLGSGNTGAHIQMSGNSGENYIDIENAGDKMVYDMRGLVYTSKQFGGTKFLNLNTGASTGNNYSISFPDASGTVALTSNIPIAFVATNGLSSTSLSAGSANYSNFIGFQAGNSASNATYSNFLGTSSGRSATDATYSNFLGYQAGLSATTASNSNFLGAYAGQDGTSASNSNFLGAWAGYQASNASNSNFFGYVSGAGATQASNSNFIGNSTGNSAVNASNSNFIGNQTGQNAVNASNSIFIGNRAGYNDTVNNTLSPYDWSVLLGYNINTGGFKNSILLGGSNNSTPISNTKANQFMLAPSVTEMRLRGVDYTLPSAQASTSGQVLTNNGSGGLSWTTVSGGSGWSLTGNSGTSVVSNFIGTTDDVDLQFRRNNTFAGQIGASNTSYGLGSYNTTSTGSSNTTIGVDSLRGNTTGFSNTSMGYESLFSNTSGYYNTSVGVNALVYNTSGSFNTSYGSGALFSNKANNRSTAMGYQSMMYADDRTTGQNTYNTAVGYESLKGSTTAANNTGQYNTAIGDSALWSNTTGSQNTASGNQSLYSNTTGSQNTASGSYSLLLNTTGPQNTANGYSSLRSNTTGFNNTANGHISLYSNTTGNQNTANGQNSLYSNTTGSYNTASGSSSLSANITGYQNTANGSQSLYSNTTGYSNTASGFSSLISNTTGTFNIGLGNDAGHFISGGVIENTTGDYNVFLGPMTKALADDDQNEIVIGYNTVGNGSNTATIGNSSLLRTYLTGVNLKAGTSTSGTAPLKFTAGTNLGTTEAGAVEYDGTHLYFTATNGGTRYQLDQQGASYPGAGIPNSTGSSWGTSYTTSGSGSVLALTTSPVFTTPSLGVATGTSLDLTAGNLDLDNTTFTNKKGVITKNGVVFIHDFNYGNNGTMTTDGYNLFIGKNAGNFTMGATATGFFDSSYNVGVGDSALSSNTTGSFNTAVGNQSLYLNTTGSKNTAFGSGALFDNTTGYQNTSVGSNSMGSNTTGSDNTAFGYSSLSSNTTGDNNTSNGYLSLNRNTTGIGNTSVGSQSLFLNTTGSGNVSFGNHSLEKNTTGYNNISIGAFSGRYTSVGTVPNETSGSSIYLGYDTKSLADGDTNEIVIGASSVGRGSNTAQWGNTSIANHYFSGSLTLSSYGPGTLTTDASGNVTASSDERLKDIEGVFDNNGNALDTILAINPILYKWNELSGYDKNTTYAGFSAQNIQSVIPEAIGVDPRGYLTLSDRPILATVVNAIKEMDLKVKEVDLKINGLTLGNMMTDFYGGIVEQVVDGVKGIVVGNLKVGSPTKRTGITLYDEVTGEPYCLSIANGQTKTVEGECPIISVEETIVPYLPSQPATEKDAEVDADTEVNKGTDAGTDTPVEQAPEVLTGEAPAEESAAKEEDSTAKIEEVKSEEPSVEVPAEPAANVAPEAPSGEVTQ